MTRGRHQEHAGQQLNLACYLFEAAALEQFREGVIRRSAGGVELDFLHEDRDLAQ
jgi:hypothetical protein